VSTVPAVGSGRRRGAITRKHRAIFLERLAAGFSVAAAAAPTGRNRQRYYELRAADPEFAEAWKHAWEAGQDAIEDELLRAATEGWEEVDEVYEGDSLVRRIVRRRKSPALLAKLERKRQPETAPLVELNVQRIEGFRPPTPADMLAFFRDTNQLHLLKSFPRLMVEPLIPLLKPAELSALALDVIDAEARALPAEGDPTRRVRSHVPPRPTPVPGCGVKAEARQGSS
jgi:hypothetical protein